MQWEWSPDAALRCSLVCYYLEDFSCISEFLQTFEPIADEEFGGLSSSAQQFGNYCEYTCNELWPIHSSVMPRMTVNLVERCSRLLLLKGLTTGLGKCSSQSVSSFLEWNAVPIISSLTDCSPVLSLLVIRACHHYLLTEQRDSRLYLEAELTPSAMITDMLDGDRKILTGALCTEKSFVIRLALSIARSSGINFKSRANIPVSVIGVDPGKEAVHFELITCYFFGLLREHLGRSLADILEVPLIRLLLAI